MYSFVTMTGTTYTVHNGRIQRHSMFGHLSDVDDWPCVRFLSPVVEGECVRMYVHGVGHLYTTPVVDVCDGGF